VGEEGVLLNSYLKIYHHSSEILSKKQQQKTNNRRSVIYHCKNCGLMKTAPEKFLGKIAPCPHCHTKSRVVHSNTLQTLWQDAQQHQKPRPYSIRLRLREKISGASAHKPLYFLLLLFLSATTAMFFITP